MLTLLAIFASSMIAGCQKTTSVERGRVSGIIKLESVTDWSGVTVMIFPVSPLPSVIVENIGSIDVKLGPDCYFDHRNMPSVAEIITDPSGNFETSYLDYGRYLLAYYKDGWGFNYVYDIELKGASTKLDTLFLYPEVSVPSAIMSTYTFSKGKTYRLTQATNALPGSEIFAYAGANIIIDPMARLVVNGDFNVIANPHEYVRVTSSSAIYSPGSSVNLASDIEFGSMAGSISLSNLLVSYLHDGVKVGRSHADIRDNVFLRNKQALQVVHNDSTMISANVFWQNNDVTGEAIYAYNTQSLNISNNLFYENGNSIKSELGKNMLIDQNLFIKGINEIQTLWESTSMVRKNTFRESNTAIGNSGKSNLEIQFNDVSASVCVRTFRTTDWINNSSTGWTKANNNNFNATTYAALCQAPYHNNGLPMPLDFTNNYWGTTSVSQIEDLIFDHNDNPNDTLPPGGSWGDVIFTPFRLAHVPGAGID